MEELVRYIVEHLVDDTSSVSVELSKDSETSATIYIHADKNVIGKIIGKNGKIAGSIRQIVKTASANTGVKYYVQIIEK